VGDSGLKAEMSEKPESFDAFLSRWINECIQKLGEVDPVDREDIVEKKAAELVALSGNFAGFYAKLDEVALPYGGVKEYVRHLYQLADARGSTTRPTAHDGADD
jgi:ABC-type enterochelin transport system substrate-binding protein